MNWSPQQDAALSDVARWLGQDGGPQVFRLFGYAGTGKTTLAKHLAADVSGNVLFGAFTGKAAHVLQQKGCPGATTIHSMIYFSRERSRTRYLELEQLLVIAMKENNTEEILKISAALREEKKKLARPRFELNSESDVRFASLVIIDECSMVDERMGNDLLSFGAKVLVLGDPAQLPPVMGGGFFTEVRHPDVMLTEIHRQAKDNPILRLATDIRESNMLPSYGSYGESSVVQSIEAEDVLLADQLLVGKNATRKASNTRIRTLLGMKSPYPVVGDRLVCLRNDHEKGLLNGAIWNVTTIDNEPEDGRMIMTISEENGEKDELTVEAHTNTFEPEKREIPWWERKEASEFDYGYALTVHKAQGSQWKSVVLVDESACFRDSRWRWLYTGVTRAAEKITIVRK